MMTESMSLDSALNRLKSQDYHPPESEFSQIDVPIMRWASTGACSKYLQEVALNISSALEASRFAKQIAASWNGAVSENAEFGYLVLAAETIRVRENFQSLPAQYVVFEGHDTSDAALLTKALVQAIKPYIAPMLDIRFFHVLVNSRPFSYLRLYSLNRLPVFVRSGDRKDGSWELLSWHQAQVSPIEKWRVGPVFEVEGYALFVRYLRTIIDDAAGEYSLRYPENPPNPVEDGIRESILELQLRKHNATTLDSFLVFLTQSLLSDDEEERAVCSRVYALLAEVCGGIGARITRLLLGLLLDEQKVARSVLESIRVLGEQDAYHFLLHNFSLVWDDSKIRKRLIDCLGALAPADTGIPDLLKLWHTVAIDADMQEAFDQAVNQIIERHRIPRFDPVVRQQFDEQVYAFSYSRAIDTLTRAKFSDVCLKRQHRECIRQLLGYGQARIESRFGDSVAHLDNCFKSSSGNLATGFDEWLSRELNQINTVLLTLSNKDQMIIGNFLDIERTIDDPELSDFYGRIYNLLDVLAKRLGRELGVLTYSNKFDPQWLDGNPSIAEYAHIRSTRQRVDRVNLGLVFRSLANQNIGNGISERLVRCADIIDELAPIAQDRNESRAGHGTNPVKDREQIPQTLAKAAELVRLTIGLEPGLSSYRDMNNWIRRILRAAETSDVAIRDFKEYETR